MMRFHHALVDDFLSTFPVLRAYADEAEYEVKVNPVDGVGYPGICARVPSEIVSEIQRRLYAVMGAPARLRATFLRLSLADVPVPHWAHTDASMGDYSLMLYLNRAEHCRGGTALVRHQDGLGRNPQTPDEAALWVRDTNRSEMWTPYLLAEMHPNRAFIFDASLMHAAMPLGGFGQSATDGRLVLTSFFTLE